MDIESAFIGNCLADPDNFHRVRSSIKTVYLQEPKNKSIWKTMELLANRNITINKTSVFQELSKKSRDKESLRTYLNSLVYDKTLKTSDYAKMITQDGQVRLLKQNLPGKEGFIDNWFSEGGNVDDFVDKEIENLLAVRSELEKEATTSQDDEALYQELLEIQRTKQSITGIRFWDTTNRLCPWWFQAWYCNSFRSWKWIRKDLGCV